MSSVVARSSINANDAREPSEGMLSEFHGKYDRLEAIRIVSLPSEIQTSNDAYSFVKEFLYLEATSVNIVPMQTEQGVRYRSAFVDVSCSTDDRSSDFFNGQYDSVCVYGRDLPGGLHFDNGKPMDHVKVVRAKPHAPSKDSLQLEDGDWTSIYIPVLPGDLTLDNGDVQLNNEDELSEFFEDRLKIGKVSRIDFMSKQVPGSDRTATCAYVHFDNWYDNHTAKLVRKVINDRGEFSCNGYYDGFEFCRFDKNRYLNFKVNHKPIPAATSDMNVHQLLARVKILEEQNEVLERKYALLEDQHAQVKADYSDICVQRSNQVMSMMAREQKINELEQKNQELEVEVMRFLNLTPEDLN